jgi:hypothetical protein
LTAPIAAAWGEFIEQRDYRLFEGKCHIDPGKADPLHSIQRIAQFIIGPTAIGKIQQ